MPLGGYNHTFSFLHCFKTSALIQFRFYIKLFQYWTTWMMQPCICNIIKSFLNLLITFNEFKLILFRCFVFPACWKYYSCLWKIVLTYRLTYLHFLRIELLLKDLNINWYLSTFQIFSISHIFKIIKKWLWNSSFPTVSVLWKNT